MSYNLDKLELLKKEYESEEETEGYWGYLTDYDIALRNAAPEMLADLRRLRDCVADMGDVLSDHIYGDKATMAELHEIYRRALAEESE
jgi:hypothetical protein